MSDYFGAMLDMSRNAVMKPEEVKKYAKLLKSLGYNMIQLYTEDTYEVSGEPYFGYLRGRYSQEELKDIVSYCNGIGVEVIPCIQTLAHLNTIFRWDAYNSSVKDCTDILLVDEPKTYELIENMIKSLRSSFTSEYIHIGCDEAHMVGLGKFLERNGYQNRFEIIHRHLERVIEIAKKYGFKPMMWSDMFFRLANPDGGYHTKTDVITDEIVASCPEGVDLVLWDYYHNDIELYDRMIEMHKKFKGELWFAGGAWCWSGWAPHNKWSLESMKPAMESCRKNGVRNVFMTMWGDNGKECSFYSVLPALYAIRRFYDGVCDLDIIKREFYDITGESFDAMMDLDAPNYVAECRDPFPTPSKYMLYSDPFLGFLDSTIVSDASARYAEYARQLSEYAEESKSYGYVFACEARLCEALELKYDLGVRTRKAYAEKNIEAIRALAEDYTVVIERVEAFYSSFRELWFRENKPYGFEVQDQRFGGLLLRLRACRDRLIDYSNGAIDSIPELEEDILDYKINGASVKEKSFNYNDWRSAVTVNPI